MLLSFSFIKGKYMVKLNKYENYNLKIINRLEFGIGCESMFPITHIWFSEKVLGKRNNMTVLGAVFPDIVISGCLNYQETHLGGWELFSYIKENQSEYMDFARSMITHTVSPKGLDYYGDEDYLKGYKGYCFQKAEAIRNQVVDACNIPSEFGLWKGHNFIEMAIEMIIVQQDKTLTVALEEAIKDTKLMEQLTNCLEGYYGIPASTLKSCIEKFASFIELRDLNSYSLAEKYNSQMQTKHCIEINVLKCSRIIEDSMDLVKDDMNEFFDYTAKKVLEIMGG